MPRKIALILSLVLFCSAWPAVAQAGPPRNIRASVNKTIVWDAVPGATEYRLEWRLEDGDVWHPEPILNSKTSFRNRNFVYEKTYIVRVRVLRPSSVYRGWSPVKRLTFDPPKDLAEPVLTEGVGVSVSWQE